MEKAIGELHEPIPPGVSQASLQGATTKLRRAYAVLDQVILAALGGDRSWNTLVWWNALQDLLAPAALLVERRQEAYLPEPTNTAHPADVIQLQGENTKEWEARTSKAMGDAANLITASGRLREAVPFMGEDVVGPAVQVLQAIAAWQQSLFGGVQAVHAETQTAQPEEVDRGTNASPKRSRAEDGSSCTGSARRPWRHR